MNLDGLASTGIRPLTDHKKASPIWGTGFEGLMEPSSAILRRLVLVFVPVLILVGIAFFVPSLLILGPVVTARLGLGTRNVLVAV